MNSLCSAARLALLGFVLVGCGGGTASGAKAGPISITASGGSAASVTSLVVATTATLSMTPTGDAINAGVDWTVVCGGNPVTGSVTNGACGTFTPVHTSDGASTVFTAPPVVPIGTTITLTASVTSNPSQRSTTSLTIVQLPIVVVFSTLGNPPPATLQVKGTTDLVAQVTNDPAGAGVIWSATCGSAACGSFNPPTSLGPTIYTAPPVVPTGGTVTVTATSFTDTTKSVSATITITPLPQVKIGVTVSPPTFYASTSGSARTERVTAVVTGDAAAAGVDWALTCGAGGSCGSIPAHSASGQQVNYVAPAKVPASGMVTLTATSTSDPTVSASAIATIVTTAPIVITIPSASALPPSLLPGAQATLAANVANDSANLGVDWSVSCGTTASCGTFNLSPAHTASGGQIVYTVAALAAGTQVTITASSPAPATTPSNPAIISTTIIAESPTISFLQSPPTTLLATAPAPVSAMVMNDLAVGGGVSWTVQCGSSVPGGCGYILPSHTASGATATYTAPPTPPAGTPMTIVASSTADPQMSVTSAPLTVMPVTALSVGFVPTAPSQVQAGTTVNLSAAVTNDAANAGVDWQVCASGCGFFTTQAATAAVPATSTTPYVPAVPEVTATTVKGWSNNLPIPYTAPVTAPPSGSIELQIAAHASPGIANSATLTVPSSAEGPALHGTVRAGTQPVVGASVGLYAAGTSGYASAATPLYAPGGASTVTTDSSGSFTVAAGYSCPKPNSQVYLVSTGGQVGSNGANPNLVLMTALGSCGALSSSPVVVNEAASVASAYATAPFASNGSLTGKSSYLYLGTSGSNVTGLVNAFSLANNLVDISTGQPRFAVPAGNGVVPYVQLNTLADLLNACAASAGGAYGDSTPCGLLFSDTAVLTPNTLPTSFLAVAPADTLQAMFNIAEHPVTNYGYQLANLLSPHTPTGLIDDAAPFQPFLSEFPLDWSLSLNYTGGGGLSAASVPGSFAVDGAGNLWITDTKAGTVAELNPIGAALSPSTGFPAGGGPIAIDAAGNIWISGDGMLSELSNLGSPIPGSPFGGVVGGGGDMAIDAQSDLWITKGDGVAEFTSLGTLISPAAGYTNEGVTQPNSVGIDSSNNIWLGNVNPADSSKGYFGELTNPGGQLVVDVAGLGQAVPEIAADASGDIWAVTSTAVCKIPPYQGTGTPLLASCYQTGIGPSTSGGTPNLLLANGAGIALDGAGTVWIASSGGTVGTFVNYPNVLPIIPSLALDTTPFYVSQSLSAGTLRLAVDGSGNIWVLLANGSVTEYVGLATPVVTPIALGLQTKQLAAKP